MDIQAVQASDARVQLDTSIKTDSSKPDVEKVKQQTKEIEQEAVKQQALSEDDIKKRVEVINNVMKAMGKDLEFVLDERVETGVVVKVFEKQSGDFIKQYPSEEMLKIMDRIDQTITGALIDDKA